MPRRLPFTPDWRCLLRRVAAFALSVSAGAAAAQTATYARGETVWTDNACSGCHTLASRRALFTSVTQNVVRTRLDAAINGTTIGGTPTGMQGFSGLTNADRDSLVIFLGNFIPVATVLPGVTFNLTSAGTGQSSNPATVTIRNDGRINLLVDANISKGGTNPNDFSFAGVGNGCAGQTVVPTANCQLTVTFTPSATGARSATLTLTHNGDPSTTVIFLNGTTSSQPPPSSASGGGGALGAGWAALLLVALGLRRRR
jgi:MYXO-CTERM domain-containing protein